MIAYIKGTLVTLLEQTIIVDVNGIGYEIHCPNPFVFDQLLEEEVFVHTYHHVRDDAQLLYGFKTDDEKYLFTKLISVSGIGPKSGLAILTGANVNEFIQAVESEDEKYLIQFPGVGKKTARQIILDLKGKLADILTVETVDQGPLFNLQSVVLGEVGETLTALGYTDREISVVLPKLDATETDTAEDLLKRALAQFAKS